MTNYVEHYDLDEAKVGDVSSFQGMTLDKQTKHRNLM